MLIINFHRIKLDIKFKDKKEYALPDCEKWICKQKLKLTKATR